MQPPTIDFNKLNNIERTIRSNQDNMSHIPPRVNLNIGTSSRNNSFSSSGNEALSDDELGMDLLVDPNVTRPQQNSSKVNLSQQRPQFSGPSIIDFNASSRNDVLENNQSPIQINKVDEIFDDEVQSVHSNQSDTNIPNLHIPVQEQDDEFGSFDDIRRPSMNSNDRSSIGSSDYDEPKSPRTILREKRKLLFKLKRYEKKGFKLSSKFSINTPLEEIQCEYETIRKEASLEQSLKVSKNILISVCSILEFMNNKFDPLDVVLDGWSEEINEDVENGDYDEVLEDLYDKYADTVEMGPEIKLLMMIGGSAVKFHLTHTVLKTVIPGAETLLKQNPGLKSDITDLISKNVPELDMKNLNSHIMPKINEVASGLTRRPSPPRKEMKGPQNVDDIIRELEESDFDKSDKKKFSINKKGKTSIQLDF